MSVLVGRWLARAVFVLALFVVAIVASNAQAARADENPVQLENGQPGTPGWQLVKPTTTFQIAGYITRPSVSPGESVPVHVNAKGAEANQDYTVEVLRAGYYGGVGARRVVGPLTQHAGPMLADAAMVDSTTGRIEANWPVSLTIDTTGFTTGAYLIKLTSAGGWQTFVPFTVKSEVSADFLFLQSHLTWQAYNTTGGNSLYQWTSSYPNFRTNWCFLWWCQYQWTDPATGATVVSGTKPAFPPNAFQVSFKRPYGYGYKAYGNAGEFLYHEFALVSWLESQGYNIAYAADFDLDSGPVPAGTRAVILPGHQEYWTGNMRTNIDAAQADGIGLVSFGANQAYWRGRLEGSVSGDIGTYTLYKTVNGEPHPSDPLKNDPALAGAMFRSTFVGQPEQLILGSQFRSWIYGNNPSGNVGITAYGWINLAGANSSDPLLAGTGITATDQFTALMGGEFDQVMSNYPSLPGVRKLFTTVVPGSLYPGGAELKWFLIFPYYVYHPLNAEAVAVEKVAPDNVTKTRIFNAGCFNWQWGLVNFTYGTETFNFANAKIQALTDNVLRWAAKLDTPPE